MYFKKIIAIFFSSLLLLSWCSGCFGNDYIMKSNLAQYALNKITHYEGTKGNTSAVVSSNLNVPEIVEGDTNKSLKIMQFLKKQYFDGDEARIDNFLFFANAYLDDNANIGFRGANDPFTKRSSVVSDDVTRKEGEEIVMPNSVDMIWDDMNGENTGWATNLPSGYRRFQGPLIVDINMRPPASIDQQLLWFEVEMGGNGSGCSKTINLATNTAVEIGWTRLYFLMNDDTWVLAVQTKDQITPTGGGGTHPHSNSYYGWKNERCSGINDRTFYNIQKEHADYNVIKSQASGRFTRVKLDHYFRYHAWTSFADIDLSKVKGIFGQTYMRLVVADTNLPDDRHLANYVAQLGNDSYLSTASSSYVGGNGVSRYKKITKSWQPINVFSGRFTKEQLLNNPPPFSSIP